MPDLEHPLGQADPVKEMEVTVPSPCHTPASEEDTPPGVDQPAVTMATAPGVEGEYRCEACDHSFLSLNQFMDHRNYVCGTGEVYFSENPTLDQRGSIPGLMHDSDAVRRTIHCAMSHSLVWSSRDSWPFASVSYPGADPEGVWGSCPPPLFKTMLPKDRSKLPKYRHLTLQIY